MLLDLNAIKARLSAAEPGPWRWVKAYEHRGVHWCLENDKSAALGSTINHNLVTLSTDEYEYDDEGRPTSLSETPDFQLIAHAPTDIAALVAEVERLRIDLEHAENEHGRVSYEARYALERYGQHRASCERLVDADKACSCGLDTTRRALLALIDER